MGKWKEKVGGWAGGVAGQTKNAHEEGADLTATAEESTWLLADLAHRPAHIT